MISEGRLVPTVQTRADEGSAGSEVGPVLISVSERVKGAKLIEGDVDGATVGVINVVSNIGLGIEEGTDITTETDVGGGGSTEPPSSVITTVRGRGPPMRASLHVATALEAVVGEGNIVVFVSAPLSGLVLVTGTEQGTLIRRGGTTVGAGDVTLVLVGEDRVTETKGQE